MPAVPHDVPPDPFAGALRLAYSYLEKRERTRSEIEGYLTRKGVDAATTKRALEALLEEGRLDDHRFARLFVADKRELDHWGSERIRRTLIGRGLDADTVSEVLAEATGDQPGPLEAELRRALELLRRRFPAPPTTRRDRDRALGVLIRKGYEPEIALDAIAVYARGV
jgi:regulatory protein